MNDKWPYPKTRLGWLWEQMKGRRLLYVAAIIGTLIYNALQLTVPYFSQHIVDEFLTGSEAAANLRDHNVRVCFLSDAVDKFLDLIGNVRDHLNGRA